ncbi:Twinfilin-1 [Drechslerella dactyloides]|uniref:Twinfilin n=1 Tax=Drechslerella dactyloides TaxID=74499 RepID=A0AAD6J2J5_DREDA|nr:Twinfilin-1 [Drechslerella dactyloides]
MQSGITASDELIQQFNSLVSSSSLRGLIAGIAREALVPVTTVPRSGTFEQDLAQLDHLLKDNEPAYIILRRLESGPAPFVCVTYVPDTAHVRSKMLFASTRNTLTRELGTEHFSETIFATTKAEVTAEGFKKHDAHVKKAAPLTEEEAALKGVKEAEAEASRGTTARASHVSSGVSFPMSDAALDALRRLPTTPNGLVQLKLDLQAETIELADDSTSTAHDLVKVIPHDEPRYSFFNYSPDKYEGVKENPIVFIYTCPPDSKIRERMLYASCRAAVLNAATKEADIVIDKKLESGAPDITEQQLAEEFQPKVEQKQAFQRPKRPGRK